MPSRRNEQKPADPRIIERGNVVDLVEYIVPRLNKPVIPEDKPRFRCYAMIFDDGPLPVIQPVMVMPDGSEHLLVDNAIAPVWFLSYRHFEVFCLVGGYEIISAPVDTAAEDTVESE